MLAGVAFAALAFASNPARAEEPFVLDYEAHEGCPAAGAFRDQVTARARPPGAGEPVLEARVRITRREQRSVGKVVLSRGAASRTREVESDECGEVASALALITAIALDPRASAGSAPVAPPAPAAPPAPPRPPEVVAPLPPAIPWAPPPPAPPPAPVERRWIAGAHVAAAFGVTPRPLLGGGLFGEHAWGGARGASLRLSVELGATGSFDVGPGGASFLRGTARVEGCPFLRPVRGIGLSACAAAEGGFLRGEGLPRGSIASVQVATVPWAALGLVPRVAIDLGAVALLGLEGGPMFPLIRRSFVFEEPAFTIHDVPPVTWTARIGVGIRF
jgi:hypothetical protein